MPKKKSRKARQTETVSPREKLKEQARHFGKEAEALGKQIGAKGEDFGKRVEKHRDEYYERFGVIGLVFSILIGILGLAIGIWALDVLSQRTGSSILFALHDFFLSNFGIFVVIFIISSALTFISRCCRTGRIIITPISAAFGITVLFWIASSIMLIDRMAANPAIFAIAQYIKTNLHGIFWFFLLLGYFLLLLQLVVGEFITRPSRRSAEAEPHRIQNSGVKRLYRSGNDRIIAGVCGGIAEYFGVDPVLVRLIWVLFALAGGSGVLLYLIAWLIIPRNPNHRW